MFVGHYAPAMALKPAARAVPLWHLFIAVQLVDYAWSLFILTGIEHASVTPGILAASHLDLYHMPYTHSLAATLVWMLAAGGVYGRFLNRKAGLTGAIIIALGAGSHWFADLIVHAPDLELFPGSAMKFGMGLWSSVLVSQTVELGLLAAGFLFYVSNTTPKGAMGKYSPWIVFAALAGAQVYTQIAPPPPEIKQFAIMALVSYTALAGLAAWLDASRAAR